VRYGVLGTLSVMDEEGRPRGLAGPARRRLLGSLLSRVGSVVSVDTLVEDLWGDTPPATADKTLQSHVMRLRDALGRGEDGTSLLTEPGGYRLAVAADAVDAWCFERDLDAGWHALTTGDPASALPLLDQALSWWRGDAYAEFPDAAFAVAERLRLAERRALAHEARTDARLALGAGAALVADLEARVAAEPYRERGWEQLIVALYRAGRPSDALAAYQRARTRIGEDLGLDPGPGLRALEQQVLTRDPALLPAVGGSVTRLPATRDTRLDVDGAAALTPTPALTSAWPEADAATAVVPDCPYRGLDAYDEQDATLFFGRERVTAMLAGRLVDSDFVVVTGASGVGKSSLLRAGLLPALRGGAIPGSAAWRCRVTTPTSAPDPWASHGLELLVVDQAEELFTVIDADTRREAAGQIRAALTAGTRVVLALRADFYGYLAELDGLAARVGASTMLVAPMTEEETRRVITEPAIRHGVRASAGFVDRIVSDVHGRAGTLPLLSAALEQSWARRTGDRLTEDDYLASGGVDGVLQVRGEAALAELDPLGRGAARRVLLRLTTRTGDVWSRRPLAAADVAPVGDATAGRALAVLAKHRVVTATATHVELAHEAMLTGWPRLASWLDERALVTDQLEHLASSAQAWDRSGRPETDLLRGPRLQAALDWATNHAEDYTPVEQSYVAASRTAADAQLQAERARANRESRQNRRLRGALVTTAALLALALVAGTVAIHQRAAAVQARRQAVARQLAALSGAEPDLSRSLLLALAARHLDDTPTTRGALLAALLRSPAALQVMHTPGQRLYASAVTSDGKTLTVAGSAGQLVSYDLHGHPLGDPVTVAAYGIAVLSSRPGVPDQLLVSGVANGHTQQPVTLLWDPTRHASVASLPGVTIPVASAAWSPDGRWLAAAQDHGDVLVWDLTHAAAPPLRIPGDANRFRRVVYAGSGTFAVVEADGTVRIWRPGQRIPVRSFRAGHGPSPVPGSPDVTAVTAAADGHLIAIGHADGTVDLWTPAGILRHTVAPGQAAVASLLLTRDGTTLFAGSDDGRIYAFTTATTAQGPSYTGHHGPVTSLAVTPNGTTLVSTSSDDTAMTWDLTGSRGLDRAFAGSGGYAAGVAYESSRGLIAQIDPDTSSIRLWDAATAASRGTAHPTGAVSVLDAAWSPDGTRLALAVSDGSVQMLDPTTRQVQAATAPIQGMAATDVAYSPDGTRIAVTECTQTGTCQLTLYATSNDTPLRPPVPILDDAGRVEWSPDGRTLSLAAWTGDHLQLRDAATQARTRDLAIGDQSLAWSPDGHTIVVAGPDGTVRLLDPATAVVRATSQQHSGGIETIAYSPDGTWIASAGDDGTTVLTETTTGQTIGTPIPARLGQSSAALFGPNDTLDIQAGDGSLTAWPLAEPRWEARACQLAGRDLTPAEWNALDTGQRQPVLCAS
jgi:WD40 repeat protein/DNA-binding SARP family transcriptional activator